MPERKRRDDLAPNLSADEDDLSKSDSIQLGDGCSISFSSAEETPTVYVKAYGAIDVIALKRKLEQQYPGANIKGINAKTPPQVRPKKKSKSSK